MAIRGLENIALYSTVKSIKPTARRVFTHLGVDLGPGHHTGRQGSVKSPGASTDLHQGTRTKLSEIKMHKYFCLRAHTRKMLKAINKMTDEVHTAVQSSRQVNS